MTQLMEQIKEKDAQAFTHSGKFHADDVFSSALLLSVNPEITIHRGSQVPEDFKGIVFDIGRGKYDHHQRDSRIREMVCRMQLSDFYGKSWVLRF